MAETSQYIFSYKEIVEALIKQQGIHEGLWSIYIEFGLGAANVNRETNSKELTPAAIIPLQKIGLQKGIEINSLTVDAAQVNPRQGEAKGSTTKKSG